MTTKKSLGLYIHIPFCKSKCLYCDFCSVVGENEGLKAKYVESLCLLIEKWAEKCKNYVVDTIYFGGGTPTTLGARELAKILECCYKNYDVTKDAEITTEANPATIDRDGLKILRTAGFNRLSMGLQSTCDDELRALGRIHSFADFVETYENARAAGFDNISADVMFGIPCQTRESYEKTLRDVISLAPEHISTYALKVEEGTPFGRLGDALVLPDEDEVAAMYLATARMLEAAGYEKYEISNFAKAGRESRHNLRYWLREEYLGFGPAAFSYFGGVRFSYAPNIVSFADGEFTIGEREKIDVDAEMTEYVMLRMRLSRGVDVADFKKRFGKDFFEVYPALLDYEKSAHVEISDGVCRFSDKGFLVSNFILSEILDFS